MATQFLFAYGTLKSDQPEHATHCAKPIAVAKGKAPGSLWRLREGYPILQIDPSVALLDATGDSVSDWKTAAALAKKSPPPRHQGQWIDGEIFAYPLDALALRKMDAWENFVPGIPSPYQRRAIWVKNAEGKDVVAWAYVCYSPPNWATLLDVTCWSTPS